MSGRLPLHILNTMLQTKQLGIEVAELAGRGRGVLATLTHPAGALVVPATEALAHSSRAPFALPPPTGAADARAAFEEYDAAARSLLRSDRRYPRLVAQVAARLATEPAEGSAYAVAVASLCAPRLAAIPEPWREDCADVRHALRFAPIDFLGEAWYAGVCGRVHLNALRAAADGSSVALPFLASFLNHAADATLEIAWDDRGEPAFHASREVQAGEELTIDYAHDAPPGPARAAFFRDQYGFEEEAAGSPT